MTGGFELGGICNGVDYGTDLVNSRGAAVVTAGSLNTKGSYVQLVASTTNDACFVTLNLLSKGDDRRFMLDLAIGAAGSEIVVAPNLLFTLWASAGSGGAISFPIHIPSGSRLAVRIQSSNVLTSTLWVNAILFDGSFEQGDGISGYDDLGTDPTNTQGIGILSGSGAKGSWTQLVASTARDYVGFLIAGSPFNGLQGLFDIGVGGAGSEVILAPNFAIATDIYFTPISGLFSINIPAGSRIATRYQAASAGVTCLALWGGYK